MQPPPSPRARRGGRLTRSARRPAIGDIPGAARLRPAAALPSLPCSLGRRSRHPGLGPRTARLSYVWGSLSAVLRVLQVPSRSWRRRHVAAATFFIHQPVFARIFSGRRLTDTVTDRSRHAPASESTLSESRRIPGRCRRRRSLRRFASRLTGPGSESSYAARRVRCDASHGATCQPGRPAPAAAAGEAGPRSE